MHTYTVDTKHRIDTLWWCRWLLLLWIAKMIEKCYRTILFGEIDCIAKRRWNGKKVEKHSIAIASQMGPITKKSLHEFQCGCWDVLVSMVAMVMVMLSIADEYAQCVRIWGAHFKCLCLSFFSFLWWWSIWISSIALLWTAKYTLSFFGAISVFLIKWWQQAYWITH